MVRTLRAPDWQRLWPDRPTGRIPFLPPFQFQKVEDLPSQRNRVHVDLKTLDLDSETDRLVALGAAIIQKFELPQIRYTTLADPDGNTFDLVQE